MRFLKKKVFGTQSVKVQSPVTKYSVTSSDTEESSNFQPLHNPLKSKKTISKANKIQFPVRSKAPKGETLTPVKSLCTKNIVKNYGKAICNFSYSQPGKEYLMKILKTHDISITIDEFFSFLSKKKDFIDSIQSFKELLLPNPNDTRAEADYKKLYQLIGEVFIKFFSVNWIFSSRLTYKDAHLKFRNKMLRRLKNPELFTYIKGFSKS
jgi:hypothetical protein